MNFVIIDKYEFKRIDLKSDTLYFCAEVKEIFSKRM